MTLIISTRVREKLQHKTPPVTQEEIQQSFANRNGSYLTDIREQHRTNPPTQWFVAETDYGRKLKVIFILDKGDVIIKSAYDANITEQHIYLKFFESFT